MTGKVLKSIGIKGYTSIHSASVELGRINVLVGANGAGKSNFIRTLEMLGRIVDEELNLFVGLNGGATAMFSATDQAKRILLRLDAPPNAYEASLVASANDELIFDGERIFVHGDGYESPWRAAIGRGQRETRLHATVDERGDRSVAAHVIKILRGCRVFHFSEAGGKSPSARMVPTSDNLALNSDASNLAAVLFELQRRKDPAYRMIVGAVRLVAPFFRDFVLKPEHDDYLRLRWRQNDSETVFSASQMSDGTLRFVCLATLLLQPELPSLVVLDEPELGLHPYAIVQLAGLLRQASVRSQVLVATQSVTLMNQFEIGDLIVVERVKGTSTFSRPDAEKLRGWLEEYSLGELWEKNLIGGRPGRGK